MGLVRTFFGMDIELLEIVRIGKEIGSAYYGDCAIGLKFLPEIYVVSKTCLLLVEFTIALIASTP